MSRPAVVRPWSRDPTLAVGFSFIYAAGIALVHAKAGWFVVGLGRDSSEFSVLLIVCLLALGLQLLRTPGEALKLESGGQ